MLLSRRGARAPGRRRRGGGGDGERGARGAARAGGAPRWTRAPGWTPRCSRRCGAWASPTPCASACWTRWRSPPCARTRARGAAPHHRPGQLRRDASAGPLRHPGGDAAAGGPVHPVLPGAGPQVVPQLDGALHPLPAGDAAHPRGRRAAEGHRVPGDDRERLLPRTPTRGRTPRGPGSSSPPPAASTGCARTSGWTSGGTPSRPRTPPRATSRICTRSWATGTWRGPATTRAAGGAPRHRARRHHRLLGAAPRSKGLAKETQHYVPKLIAAR